jgi:hypothetical protein
VYKKDGSGKLWILKELTQVELVISVLKSVVCAGMTDPPPTPSFPQSWLFDCSGFRHPLLAISVPNLLFLSGLSSAGVAQLVEHLICNQRVGGSIPSASSTIFVRGVRAERIPA